MSTRIYYMKSKLIVMLALLFVYPAAYAKTFVFFGDSLTDAGNYPEPENLSARSQQ